MTKFDKIIGENKKNRILRILFRILYRILYRILFSHSFEFSHSSHSFDRGENDTLGMRRMRNAKRMRWECDGNAIGNARECENRILCAQARQ